MKLCTALIFLLVLLTGCASQKTNDSSSINVESTNTELIAEESNAVLEEVETEALEVNWQTAYRKQLEEIMNDKKYTDQVRHFSLYDLTGDEIPELIVSMGQFREGCSVYTFDEKLIDFGHFGSHSSMTYYPDKNILESNYSESGIVSLIYLQTNKINNGSFSRLEYLESYTPAKGTHKFKIDYKPVTEEEYQEAIGKYTNENKISLGYDYKLSEGMLNAVFSDHKDWRECYKSLIHGIDDLNSKCRFSLYDISGDDIPELFISEDDCHAAGCSVYSFTDKLISFGEFGSWGKCIFYPNKNTLRSSFTGQGSTYSSYFKIDNNDSLIELASFYDNSGAVQEPVYKVNDVEVTEEEFNEAHNKYSDDNVVYLGRDFPFNEAFVDAVFNGESDWKECYKNLLYVLQDSEDCYRFSLYDITGDDIPELFISEGYGRVHACNIYSFQDYLIPIGRQGTEGLIAYSPSHDLFYVNDLVQGHEYFIYYTLNEDNDFQCEMVLYNNVGGAPTKDDIKYEINHEEVSYEEYKSVLDEYLEIDDFVSLGWDYCFTEKDITNALSQTKIYEDENI